MQSILLVSNSPNTTHKAGFIVFHPERNNLISKFCPLTTFTWKSLNHISDFGLIYVPPRTKRKLKVESGYIYIIGGYDNIRKKFLRSILRYDMLRGEWFHCRKMNTRRACFTPFLSDGKIFCAGGNTSKTMMTDLVEYYEPMMDMIENSESLPSPCSGYACAYDKNKVFIIGGNIQLRNGVTTTSSHFWSFEYFEKEQPVDSMNPEIFYKFISIDKAKVPIQNGIIGHKIVISEKNNRIYLIGGTNKNNDTKSSIAGLYYANIDSIMALKESPSEEIVWYKRNIPEMQRSYNGVSLINNKIFIVGGLHNKFNSTVTIMEVDEEDINEGDHGMNSDNVKDADEMRILFLKNNKKPLDMVFLPVNEMIGYFDWRRKIYQNLYSLNSSNDINLEGIHCVVVDMHDKYAEFNKDRYDWLIQWALW